MNMEASSSSSFYHQPQLDSSSSNSYHTAESSSTIVEINHEGASSNHSSSSEAEEYRADLDRLYLATLKGDWIKAIELMRKHPTIAGVPLNSRRETALHIAAGAQQVHFVEELVKKMDPEELKPRTGLGFRALCFAAISGNTRIGRAMVSKNGDLPYLPGFNDSLPLRLAITYKRTDMAYYLRSVTHLTDDRFHKKEKVQLLHAAILSDYYEIGMEILKNEKELAWERNEDNGQTALHVLAGKKAPPLMIGSTSLIATWNKWIIWPGSRVEKLRRTYDAYEMVELVCKSFGESFPKRRREMLGLINSPSSFMDDAARVGNAEFLSVLISFCPYLIVWNLNENKSIFHIAVEYRQESVFKLIHEIRGFKHIIAEFLDSGNQNMLSLVANLPAREHLERVSTGAFLQLQRELQWFQEVEKLVAVPSSDVNKRWETFRESHKELQKNGEEWMKRTASSCMLVVTLIATVVYTAAFTLPGGNNQETGVVIFKHKTGLQVFLILDTLALMSSTISILIFLSILTSRVTQKHFLKSLPRKFFWGLSTLLISIAFMNMAFCTAFFLHYNSSRSWTPWFLSALAFLSFIILFALEYSLLNESFVATFFSAFKPRRRNLF